MSFKPHFTITTDIANYLTRIEAAKQSIDDTPITPTALATLRESSRLSSTHYTTKIEGNILSLEDVSLVLQGVDFPNKKEHEHEIKGQYLALETMERMVAERSTITESVIKTLHGAIMSGGAKRFSATPYRDGQNVIRNGSTGQIVYMPPMAHDVPELMQDLAAWLQNKENLPIAILAAIAHYQLATIHPYYDGNGRLARLITTMLLHIHGYGLKGIYALDEYYAKHLSAYYDALSIGPSHNYYEGRAEADITKWITYFCKGMAHACENVKKHVVAHTQTYDDTLMRSLDAKKRKALTLFARHEIITSKQVAELFGFKPRTARQLCLTWSNEQFIVPVDHSKKGRKYKLSEIFAPLLTQRT